MAKAPKEHKVIIHKIEKKTSSSAKPKMVKTSSMNKHKRKSYKVYNGQGR